LLNFKIFAMVQAGNYARFFQKQGRQEESVKGASPLDP
jgi:hypothetical protein